MFMTKNFRKLSMNQEAMWIMQKVLNFTGLLYLMAVIGMMFVQP
jgi:hypothetical protein